ncbi:hypothetical protein [Streptomyces sp. NPDC058695]|uniref:hypothetical protein n=1 Tax=Streptomyces sp. NPDC058695 TaxID=3346604 RepID=UPI00365E3688
MPCEGPREDTGREGQDSRTGTVAVATETGELPLGPAKRSGLLAMLLLRPDSLARVEQLIGPP